MCDIHTLVAETAHHWELLESLDGTVVYSSPSSLDLTGFAPEHFKGRADALLRVAHATCRAKAEDFVREMRQAEPHTRRSMELRIETGNGAVRWVSCNSCVIPGNNGSPFLRSTLRDISSRKALDLEMEHARLTDPLTRLYNRNYCLQTIKQLLDQGPLGKDYAVVALDIDRLKKVNETLGPTFGDDLVCIAAERIASTVARPDVACRLSGDGFAVILQDKSPREVMRYVRGVQAMLDEPFNLRGHEVNVTPSAGVLMSPALYENPEELLRNVSIALRRARESRRNRCKVFHSRLFVDASRQHEIEVDLHAGLRNGEFFLVYQPIIDLESNTVTSIEALLRWNHPRHGLMSPDEFLPVAEATDFIVPLGEWVLFQACQDMVGTLAQRGDMGRVTMSVNISARQLAHHSICNTVARALRQTGLAPQSLKLEITETIAMENPVLTAQRLHAIKALGVRISIDDFGTGYSSLSSLMNFPIDTLKVDKSFVGLMDSNTEQRKIVRTIIALAHSLNLEVVAEGIEQHEQWSMLKMLDCQSGQGFLFSHPVDVGTLRAFICKERPSLRQ
ncbi:MAG: bifunctional diguanylate cyclase/phosphodiesterase [Proteobacteria bacterium]|nr:bifunctional diguanylate cyclase/phosphodiesterase [Pseudomonadota bacterium]MBU1596285.1 bifunctional diguanylate cyclase/phosphodiesterase [Pseudomonadota bacterium]